MALTFNDQGLRAKGDTYEKALEKYVQDAAELGTYPPTVMVALGGTGAKALQHVRRLMLERFGSVAAMEGVAFLSLDTDVASTSPSAEKTGDDPFVREVSFREEERLNLMAPFRDYLGPRLVDHPHIREWWDTTQKQLGESFNLEAGAGQIRPVSRLVVFASRQKILDKLDIALNKVRNQGIKSPRVDKGQKTRIVIVAGLAGGTGSGAFLDVAAMIRQVARDVNVEGYFALPGVFKGAEGVYPKIAANGYAALRELNHFMTHPFKARYGAREREAEVRGLYDRCVLFSGTNHANQTLRDSSDCYALIGEQLFIDFSEGGMARWVQGVRINRAQYLLRSVDREYKIQMPDGSVATSHAESWPTCFQSFGISKIVFPSWRLLSYASYELAAQMMSLLDPGRGGTISDMLTELRDGFAMQAGFFQGERATEDGGRQSVHQVIYALRAVRGAQSGKTTFDELVDQFAQELVDQAEVMFTNKSSSDDMNKRFREVQSLLGDPFSAMGAGDWAKQIQENRKLFSKTVSENLPNVVEDYRLKPSVGPSGVSQLLAELIDGMQKPPEQARYIPWMQKKHMEMREQRVAAIEQWNRQVKFASEAERGWFSNKDNHREAVGKAAQAFGEYWKCAVYEYLFHQGIEALQEVQRTLVDQNERLRRIYEGMLELRSTFQRYRDFFARPQRATSIQELRVPDDLSGVKMLEPYLGNMPKEREERLKALLNRGLSNMGLRTLADLEKELLQNTDRLRSRLFELCFLALKGRNGVTNDFRRSEDEEHNVPGFIQHYSAVKMLRRQCGNDNDLRDIVNQMYSQGLPWVKPRPLAGMGLSEDDIPRDCFVGFNDDDADAKAGGKLLLETLQGRAGDGFRAKRVKVADPSEILFYTETVAFPAAYINELYDDNGLQRYYRDAQRSGTAVHITRDFHIFQNLLPLLDNEIRDLKRAWRLFVMGMMFGCIRAEQPVADEMRFVYAYRRQVSAFEQRWDSLGPEQGAIRRLMDDNALVQTLTNDIEEARLAYEKRGLSAEMLAMAEYYFYCLYPLRKTSAVQSGAVELVGSAENEACSEIRNEMRLRIEQQTGRDRASIDQAIYQALSTLPRWARPIARLANRPTPAAPALRDEDRASEWSLQELVYQQVRQVPGFIAPVDTFSEGQILLPRLAITDDPNLRGSTNLGAVGVAPAVGPPTNPVATPAVAASTAQAPSVATGPINPAANPNPNTGNAGVASVGAGTGADTQARYHYAGPAGRAQNLSAADVATRVKEAPSASHKVWREGLKNWVDVKDEAPIQTLLAPPAPPPLDDGAPPLVDENLQFYYACDKQNKGEMKVRAIAEAVAAAPASSHKVWRKGMNGWLDAAEVAEIQAILRTMPPPLDDGPPPLDDDGPPPL